MARLRRVDCSGPGIRRRRRGRGFEYLDATGARITDAATLARIGELAIPPAWRDVWICPDERGHLQAVGTDAAGRRQYLYHPDWRRRRDRQKFERMVRLARVLPELRAAVEADLALPGMPQAKVLACAVRLLDRGFFRVGGEDYAEDNGTYGLATIRRSHVRVSGGEVIFDYVSKGGKRRVWATADPVVVEIVGALRRRRGGNGELLAHRQDRHWVDVTSADINAYIKERAGEEFTAKDFRTWSATVLAAVALAVSGRASSPTARKRAITRAVAEVAGYLGNTPAVCRASYIDPRVFDRYLSGWTIAGALERLGAEAGPGDPSIQGGVEEAVLDLLEDRRSSEALERTG